MTSSDIIAVVAIVASAIVSIIAGVISYKNNKMTLDSRRSELAFEKQLNAFREITEQLGNIETTLLWSASKQRSEQDKDKMIIKLGEAIFKYKSVYHSQVIYFPPKVSESISNYAKVMTKNIEKLTASDYSQKSLHDWLLDNAKVKAELIMSMQSFISG